MIIFVYLDDCSFNSKPMALPYRPVKRANPVKRGEPEMYYPNPVYREKVGLRKLSAAIAARTTLSTVDTMAVLEACTEMIPLFLTGGAIVSLGDFGSFRITLKGTGSATAKEMTAANITEIRVKFRPGKEFASRVKEAELEKEKR
jgi:predicted histone-like DNA-binding protein